MNGIFSKLREGLTAQLVQIVTAVGSQPPGVYRNSERARQIRGSIVIVSLVEFTFNKANYRFYVEVSEM